jgi:hypothetical protein
VGAISHRFRAWIAGSGAGVRNRLISHDGCALNEDVIICETEVGSVREQET